MRFSSRRSLFTPRLFWLFPPSPFPSLSISALWALYWWEVMMLGTFSAVTCKDVAHILVWQPCVFIGSGAHSGSKITNFWMRMEQQTGFELKDVDRVKMSERQVGLDAPLNPEFYWPQKREQRDWSDRVKDTNAVGYWQTSLFSQSP